MLPRERPKKKKTEGKDASTVRGRRGEGRKRILAPGLRPFFLATHIKRYGGSGDVHFWKKRGCKKKKKGPSRAFRPEEKEEGACRSIIGPGGENHYPDSSKEH